MANKILFASFISLWKMMNNFPEIFLAILDNTCSKLNEVYKNRPSLLLVQIYSCYVPSMALLAYSNVTSMLFQLDPTSFLRKVVFIGLGLYALLAWEYIILVLLTFDTAFDIFELTMTMQSNNGHHRASPAVRAGMQWLLQALITYLSEMAKSKKSWADWQLTFAVLLFYFHVISVLKFLGKFRYIGAADALFSIFNVFMEEILRDWPTTKLFFAIVFALAVFCREHRAKVKEEEDTMRRFNLILFKLILLYSRGRSLGLDPGNQLSSRRRSLGLDPGNQLSSRRRSLGLDPGLRQRS